MKPLTINETIALQHLSKAEGNTPWHEAIRLAFKKHDQKVYKALLIQLSSQLEDNPSLFKQMFGENVLKAIKRCEKISHSSLYY